MTKRAMILALAVLGVFGFLAMGSEKLVVYTYDSFVSWGPAKILQKEFKARYDCDVEFVAAGGAKATLSRLLAEREAGGTQADVFMAEMNEVPRIQTYDLFLPLSQEQVPNLAHVPQSLQFDPSGALVPYEYGYITLTYDSRALEESALPQSLEALTDPAYKGKIICEDPRTSSTGFSFLLWTIARFGENGYLAFWRKLAPNLLVITQGWSEAWSLMTHGEAPIMVSYSTDTAYEAASGDPLRYRAFAPGGEGYRTVYGVGVVKDSPHPQLAEDFVNLLLSQEIQELLPTTEAMLPANETAALPSAYQRYTVTPDHAESLPLSLVAQKMAGWLSAWERAIAAP
jgi:thiamine transport system substrate-binding protein